MDAQFQVEVDPNEDTEWNDILRKHKIIPEKPPSPSAQIEEAVLLARQLAHDNRLEGKTLNELDDLEDDEDDDFLEQYRQKRIAELATITNASVYNQVYHLQKPDFMREVTEESNKAYVFVLLTSSLGTNTESAVAVQIWRELAQKFGDVKFGQIRGDLCIEGYPDRNTPTVLVYRDGQIKKQLVTLRELKGVQTKVEDFEKILVDVGAIKVGDARLRKDKDVDGEDGQRGGMWQGKRNATVEDDDDDDWD